MQTCIHVWVYKTSVLQIGFRLGKFNFGNMGCAQELAAYLKLEGETEGYSVVFDYRQSPESRFETGTVDGHTIHSYIIPVLQEVPSVAAGGV